LVNLKEGYIQIQGKRYEIKTYEVWWGFEGLGLFSSLEEAKAVLGNTDVSLLNMRPVPVAVSDHPGVYEAI